MGTELWRWAGPVVTGSAGLQDSWMLQRSNCSAGEAGQLRRASQGLTAVAALLSSSGNAWSNAQSSADVVAGAGAGTAARQAMPSGVRMVLGFAPGSGFSGSLTRDVALGPQQP